jgi:hypothetical protein
MPRGGKPPIRARVPITFTPRIFPGLIASRIRPSRCRRRTGELGLGLDPRGHRTTACSAPDPPPRRVAPDPRRHPRPPPLGAGRPAARGFTQHTGDRGAAPAASRPLPSRSTAAPRGTTSRSSLRGRKPGTPSRRRSEGYREARAQSAARPVLRQVPPRGPAPRRVLPVGLRGGTMRRPPGNAPS